MGRQELPVYMDKFTPAKTNWNRSRTVKSRLHYAGLLIAALFVYYMLWDISYQRTYEAGVQSSFYEISENVPNPLFMNRLASHTKSRYDKTKNYEFYDLNDFQGHGNGHEKEEFVLMCIPLRNAAPVLPMMFSHLYNLTYPHRLLDLVFLVSDTDDSTVNDLHALHYSFEQKYPGSAFNSVTILEKDFGQVIGQGFDDRHAIAVQAQRRKLMGRARNWLLSNSLKPYHSWVYWRDADIERSPPTIIEDLMHHDVDVIVPNVWRPLPEWMGGEQPYDLNAWQESQAALDLAAGMEEDDVIVEGYAECPTWRAHMAYFRAPDGDPNEIMDLDGVGGVSILAKSRVFRQGANFPGFALWNHAETEGFGKICRHMGFSVKGKVHYTIWHLYEPSEDDLKQEKEREEKAKLEEQKSKMNTISLESPSTLVGF